MAKDDTALINVNQRKRLVERFQVSIGKWRVAVSQPREGEGYVPIEVSDHMTEASSILEFDVKCRQALEEVLHGTDEGA